MLLYTVRQEAGYYHSLVGVFYTREEAEKVAVECADKDTDNHHEYAVGAVEVGKYVIEEPEYNTHCSEHILDCVDTLISFQKGEA